MKIYIFRDEKEHGPYSRSEIFALMRTGELSAHNLGRVEDELERKPLSEILVSGKSSFLTVTQIEEKQSEAPVPQIFIPDYRPKILSEEEVKPKSSKRFGSAILASILIGVVTLHLIYSWGNREETPSKHAEVSSDNPDAQSIALLTSASPKTPEPEVAETPPAKEFDKHKSNITDQKQIAKNKVKAAEDSSRLSIKRSEDVVQETPRNNPKDNPQELQSAPNYFGVPDPTPAPASPISTTSEVKQSLGSESHSASSSNSNFFGTTADGSSPTNTESLPEENLTGKLKVTLESQEIPSVQQFALRQEELKPFEHRVNPFVTPEWTESELVQILADRFAYRPPRRPPARLPGPPVTFYESSFELSTNLKFNPKIRIVYKIPILSNRAPGPNADQIVTAGYWPPAMEPPQPKTENGRTFTPKPHIRGELQTFCTNFGFTAFQLLIHSPQDMWNDPRESYFKGGPEWVDLVFKAQQEIIKRHHLKSKKLLLIGHSLGGAFVQRIAAARPDAVTAVSVSAATEITLPKSPANVAWFLAINRGDSMQSEYCQLYSRLINQGATTIFNVFPPGISRGEYHQESGSTRTACELFLKGVAERQSSKGVTNPENWPFVRDRKKPLKIVASRSPSAQCIPVPDREYIPSLDLVEHLQAVPAPMQSLHLPQGNGRRVKCRIGLPPLGSPKGILIYLQKPGLNDLGTFFDNVYFLAGLGYMVISPVLNHDETVALDAVSRFIKNNTVTQKLPVAYVAWGDVGHNLWTAVSRRKILLPSAMALVDFNPQDSFDESKLGVGDGVNCPVLFVNQERNASSDATSEKIQESLRAIRSIKEYLEKSRLKGHYARSVIVAEGKQEENEAQQSINFSSDFITKIIEQRRSEIFLP